MTDSLCKVILIAGGISMVCAPVAADYFDLIGHVPESPTVFTTASTVSGSSEADPTWFAPETINGDEIEAPRHYADDSAGLVIELPDWFELT